MCGYVPGVHDVDADSDTRTPGHPKSTLLAIDTSIGTSVALGVDGEVFEASSDDPRGHTEVIGRLIAEVFAAAQVSPDRVTGVVMGVGPGPFTGLRVGIAAAKAFAVARGVRLLPLQGHEAVAFELMTGTPRVTKVRVVQDAKRRELFVSEFDGVDAKGLPVRTVDAHLVPRADLIEESRDVWPERIPAGALVRLANLRLDSWRKFESQEALYLRAPDVKPAAQVKRVSAGG